MDNLYKCCLLWTWVLPVGFLSQENGTAKGGKGEELSEQGREQEDNNRAIHIGWFVGESLCRLTCGCAVLG